MKFVSVPKNGSSWRKPLLYAIDTESEAEQDVEIEIKEVYTGRVLGRQLLHRITAAEVNIAPYILGAVSVEPIVTSSATVVVSPSAICVYVVANGVYSPMLQFFRESVHMDISTILSHGSFVHGIARGDSFMLSAVVGSHIDVAYTIRREDDDVSHSQRLIVDVPSPVEIVIPISPLDVSACTLCVTLRIDDEIDREFEVEIVEPLEMSRRVVWYNERGGVECYTFPVATPRKVDVRVDSRCQDVLPGRVVESSVSYRLLSHNELQTDMNRVVGMLRSPELYDVTNRKLQPLRLLSRELMLDSHGRLSRLELDCVEEWKGGALW